MGVEEEEKEASDIMDTKLTILFLFITTVVALTSFGEGSAGRVLQQIRGNRRR